MWRCLVSLSMEIKGNHVFCPKCTYTSHIKLFFHLLSLVPRNFFFWCDRFPRFCYTREIFFFNATNERDHNTLMKKKRPFFYLFQNCFTQKQNEKKKNKRVPFRPIDRSVSHLVLSLLVISYNWKIAQRRSRR